MVISATLWPRHTSGVARTNNSKRQIVSSNIQAWFPDLPLHGHVTQHSNTSRWQTPLQKRYQMSPLGTGEHVKLLTPGELAPLQVNNIVFFVVGFVLFGGGRVGTGSCYVAWGDPET